MRHRELSDSAVIVAVSTAAAVHRRDHIHNGEPCHPHVIEVVGLGTSATAVCHDCDCETGFIDAHNAQVVAEQHRRQTA